MKNHLLIGLFLGLSGLVPALAQPQFGASPTPAASPALGASSTPAVSTTPGSGAVATAPEEKAEENSGEGEDTGEEKPFAPHWTGQLGLTYSNQPDPQGQGQITEELSMTGTYNINEENTYVSLAVASGQQDLEGSRTNYGTLTLEGAYGFGFFQPALSLAQQEGASALNSTTATLTLNFQFWDPLSIGLLGDAGLESHQGPVSTFSPLAANGDTMEEGDSYNWLWGAEVSFTPWDFLSFTLTGEMEYDNTYQFQNIYHTVVHATNNQYDQIDSLTLSSDFSYFKDFSLDLSFQLGQDFQPAGVFYSAVRKRTLFNPNPTEQNFTAFTVGLVYNLQ